MDNTTNIIYNIKAIDNATTVISSVLSSLQALKAINSISVNIKVKGTNLTKLTDKLNKAVEAMGKIPQSINSNVQVEALKTASTETEKIKTNVKETNNWYGKWGSTLGKAISRFVSFRKIINGIVSSLKESADWVENLHLFEVAFDDASKEAYDFGRTISTTFGTSINETMRYLAVFRQMTDAIGIADATATKMSKTLTALGYDIASLYNLNIESAMEKLEAGIAGQTKPLRTLGMDITAQSLDNYLEQTLKLTNITSKQMTQADKMILRTIVIMEQAQNSYGDMAKTLNSFANQVKVLQGSFENFKLAMGDLIQKYFKPVISFLAGVLMAITDIIRAFAPIDDTSGIDNLKNSLVGVDEELEDIAEKAGLLSFDKFEALTKSNSGSADSSNITSILTDVFDTKYQEYMEQFQQSMHGIENDAGAIAKKIKEWVFPFAEWDEQSGELIGELGKINGWLKAIWEISKIIIALAISSKLAKLPKLLETIGNSIGAVTASAKAANAVWASLAAFGMVYLLIDLITNFKELDAWGKTWRITLIVLFGAIALVKSGMIETLAITGLFIKDGIIKLISVIKTSIAWIGKMAVALWTKMIAALKGVATTLTTTVFPAMLQFSATIGGLCVGIAALGAGIAYYITSMDKMSTTAKVLIPIIAALSAVFVGLAVARAAAAAGIGAPVMAGITAAALTAGIVLAAGTAIAVATYANGGYPEKGQLFIANERGPELVGSMDGKNAVANNDMIITAIENAAYRGFARAVDDANATQGNGGKGGTIVLNINGREIARATAPDMADEFSRRNIKIK